MNNKPKVFYINQSSCNTHLVSLIGLQVCSLLTAIRFGWYHLPRASPRFPANTVNNWMMYSIYRKFNDLCFITKKWFDFFIIDCCCYCFERVAFSFSLSSSHLSVLYYPWTTLRSLWILHTETKFRDLRGSQTSFWLWLWRTKVIFPKLTYSFQHTVCVLTVSPSKMKRIPDNKTKRPKMKDQIFLFPSGNVILWWSESLQPPITV